jgi:hypothetical protein
MIQKIQYGTVLGKKFLHISSISYTNVLEELILDAHLCDARQRKGKNDEMTYKLHARQRKYG